MLPETMLGLLGSDTIAHDATAGGEEGEVLIVCGGVVGVSPHGFEVFYGGIVFGLIGVGFAKGEGVVAVGLGGVIEWT
jgi:hypothetical protein